MQDPFTEPHEKGQPPYWLRLRDAYTRWQEARHLRLLRKMEQMHREYRDATTPRKDP